jgi:hypothetical protein
MIRSQWDKFKQGLQRTRETIFEILENEKRKGALAADVDCALQARRLEQEIRDSPSQRSEVALPPGVVIEILLVVAPAGTVTVSWVSEFTTNVAFLLPIFTNDAWVSSGTDNSPGSRPFYGISSVLTAPQAVPEPSSLITAIGALALMTRRRQSKQF